MQGFQTGAFQSGAFQMGDGAAVQNSGGWDNYKYLNWRERERREEPKPKPVVIVRAEIVGTAFPPVVIPEVASQPLNYVLPPFAPISADEVAMELERKRLAIIAADDEWLLMN